MSYLFLSCTEIIIEAPMNKSLIIFGIVNITSDSFSDGGRYLAPDAAIAQARKLMAEGADVIDLGPASSGTVAKLSMRQPFVLFKGLTFQKLCLPGAFRPGDHHNKMLRPGLCVVHASPQYL